MWPEGVIPAQVLEYLPEWAQGMTGALVGGGVVLGTGVTGSFVKGQLCKWALSKKRKQKQQDREKAMLELEQQLAGGKLNAAERKRIVELSLSDLVGKLQKGVIKPTEALEAYQARALEVDKDLNCIVEPIKEAQSWAEELEKQTEKGPLYGLPVSIKDNYGIKGYDCTAGLSNWINKPYDEDAVIVTVLKKQGAIPFVKTNVPQTMISYETTNPIYGPTKNPYDLTRGVGGSSGGEGALIAGGGSLLGFGSDIGGSIRIPSNMCGVCGLKPTDTRVSSAGTTPLLKGQTCVKAAYGPLASDVDGLVLAMRALMVPEQFRLDPTVPCLPFNSEMFENKRKLRIGYFVHDGNFHAVPAQKRAVLKAKAALEKLGHELVLWEFPDVGRRSGGLWAKALFGDGGAEIRELMRGDAMSAAIKSIALVYSVPRFIKWIMYGLMRFIYPNVADTIRFSMGSDSVTEWWNVQRSAMDFRQEVLDDWKEKGIDAMISPGFGCPAVTLGVSQEIPSAATYCMVYNVLNFPAGSLPVTTVTAEDTDSMKDYPLIDPIHRRTKQVMVGSEGLPVNVQIAALPWQEELVLRIMKDLESQLKN